jgi:hypothetical protein
MPMSRPLDYIRSQVYPRGGSLQPSGRPSAGPHATVLGTIIIVLGVIAFAYVLTGLSQL